MECGFGHEAGEVRFVGALREVGEDDVASGAVKFVLQPVGEVFVREVPGAGQYSLFKIPGIYRTGTQHIAAVVRLNDDRVTAFELFFDQIADVAKIH